jgi:DNA topoisomerase III
MKLFKHCPATNPFMQTERSMVQVCDRVKTKDDMLFESIEQYKEVFLLVRREFERVVQVRLQYLMAR